MSISYIISFEVKQEQVPEFVEIMNSVKTDLPEVMGCNGVNIFNDIEYPHKYTLVESWNEKGSHEKHLKNLVDSGIWDTISTLLDAEPIGNYFDEV